MYIEPGTLPVEFLFYAMQLYFKNIYIYYK